MSDNSSESKTHDATSFRLRKLREQGQIPKSGILIKLIIHITGMFMLFMFFDVFLSEMFKSIEIISYYISQKSIIIDFEIIKIIFKNMLYILILFNILLIFFGICSHIIYSKGLVIAPALIAPKFSKLSPIDNIKNTFKKSQITERVIGIIKCVIWCLYVVFILSLFHEKLFASLQCGFMCISLIFNEIMIFLIGGSILLALISIVIDMPMQKAFFLANQKTGLSQYKRDRKETLGSPEMRREVRKQGKKLYNSNNGNAGVDNNSQSQSQSHSQSTSDNNRKKPQHFDEDKLSQIKTKHKSLCKNSFVFKGKESIVGIRFSLSDEFPIPVIVEAGSKSRFDIIETEAKKLKIPILEESNFVDELGHNHEPGSVLPEKYFPVLGEALKSTGLFA